MMKTIFMTLTCVIALGFSGLTQVAVNTTGATPDASAMLDVSSNAHGVLIPRMSTASRNGISNPALGLLVYDMTVATIYMNTGSPATPNWVPLSRGQLWTRFGTNTYLSNAGDHVGIGTSTPAEKLEVQGNIRYNGMVKDGSLTVLNFSGTSTLVGKTSNTTNTGANNSFIGNSSGQSNSTGFMNTYLGDGSGQFIQTGNYNVLIGYNTGSSLAGSASSNVFLGNQAGPLTNASNLLYINNTIGTPLIYGDFSNGYVGLNTENPGTNFAVYESNGDLVPASLVEQGGAGDAAQRFLLTQGQSFCLGIDNSDNDNFRISSGANLGTASPPLYNEATTMVRIHSENPQPGIIDFNHQSRARVWLQENSMMISPYFWTTIMFDMLSYDEHGEWIRVPGAQSNFVALEEGYYQVNARTEFTYLEAAGIPWGSIAIYKNGVMYAQGNNMQLTVTMEEGANNNAPNVSDVVHLTPGDFIEIKVFHTVLSAPVQLRSGESQTYCSIHKVS